MNVGVRPRNPFTWSLIHNKKNKSCSELWEFQPPPFLATCIGSVLEVGLTPCVRAVIGDTLTLPVTSALTHFSSWNFFYIIAQTDPAHSFSCIFKFIYLAPFPIHIAILFASPPLFIFCYLVTTNELKRKE